MKHVSVISILIILLSLTGCDKITPEGKRALAQGAVTAIERSRNFELIKDKLTAVKPENAPLIEEWKKAHSEGLAAEAKALADINKIVNKVDVKDAKNGK